MPFWQIAIIVAVVAESLAVWLGIFFFLAKLAWGKLATRYKTEMDWSKLRRLNWQSISINGINYNNCVSIGVSKEGIGLGVFPRWLFPFHPPVFVPWGDIELVKVHEGWLQKGMLVKMGQPPLASVWLPLRVLELAEQLRAAKEESGN